MTEGLILNSTDNKLILSVDSKEVEVDCTNINLEIGTGKEYSVTLSVENKEIELNYSTVNLEFNSREEYDPVFTNWLLSANLLDRTVTVIGDFGSIYTIGEPRVIEVPFKERGAGITVTSITVNSYENDPSTELVAYLQRCDAQTTGAFPGTNPTVIRNISTTTGNYSSGTIAVSVPTTKLMYISLNADPGINKRWKVKITYTVN